MRNEDDPSIASARAFVTPGTRSLRRVAESLNGMKRSPRLARLLKALSAPSAVWLHLDVDVLDPSVMPVLFPVPRRVDT
jgi:arginase family enzyme